MLTLLEARLDELGQDILKTDEDILLIPQYASLVASTTSREYPFPSDMLARVKRVEAKLDGTNWLKLNEFDITQHDYPITLEADITKYFSNVEGECFYDIMRKTMKIYSGTISAVTDGLMVWINTWPTTLTSLAGTTTDLSVDPSTNTHGIPRELHEILARGVIIDWKSSREKPIPLTEKELRYDIDKKTALNTLRHGNLDREVIGHLPPASARGNDGYDY
jgi:hypothetical protein